MAFDASLCALLYARHGLFSLAKLTKPTLAKKAKVGLSTLDALENGRMGELGYSKITHILTALGLAEAAGSKRTPANA